MVSVCTSDLQMKGSTVKLGCGGSVAPLVFVFIRLYLCTAVFAYAVSLLRSSSYVGNVFILGILTINLQ